MISILKKHDIQVGVLALMGLMLATRFHHFGSVFLLPDASLVVFFLSGLFYNRLKVFILLLAEAALIDYVAIAQLNVSDYCVSPAYLGLIPTYAAMWLAGAYCVKFKKLNSSELFTQFSVLFMATSIAFLISNGTFYLFSGRFAQMSMMFYIERVEQFYLPYLTTTLLYGLAIGAGIKLVHALTNQAAESKSFQ
jgi:hypothetical protein